MINKETFVQDISKAINSFIRDRMDVLIGFDYDTVKRINKDINEGKVDNKPILHIQLTSNQSGKRTVIGDSEGEKVEGRKHYIEFAIYTIIRSDYEEGRGRKIVLDGVVDNLKHIFDSEGDLLPFKQPVLETYTSDLMGENNDNLYAIENVLEFWVLKEL